MKKMLYTLLICTICSSLAAQQAKSRKGPDALDYLFDLSTIRNANDEAALKRASNDTNSFKKAIKVDSLIAEYEKSSRLKLDPLIKYDISSRAEGFYLFLKTYEADFKVNGMDSDSIGIIRQGNMAIKAYLNSISQKERPTLQKLWGTALLGNDAFYLTIQQINAGRKTGSHYKPPNTPPQDIENTPEWWHKNLDNDLFNHYAYLELNSIPDGCSYEIDGKAGEDNTNITLVWPIRSDGTITVVLRKSGFKLYTEKVKVSNGKTAKVNAKLKKD